MGHNKLTRLPAELELNANLRILDAGGNPIKQWAGVEVIQQLRKLQQLTLAGCPLAKEDGYRARVLEMVPTLEVLDGRRVEGRERRHKAKRLRAHPRDATQREENLKPSKKQTHAAPSSAAEAKTPKTVASPSPAADPLDQPEAPFLSSVVPAVKKAVAADQEEKKPKKVPEARSGVVAVLGSTSGGARKQAAGIRGKQAVEALLRPQEDVVLGELGEGMSTGWDAWSTDQPAAKGSVAIETRKAKDPPVKKSKALPEAAAELLKEKEGEKLSKKERKKLAAARRWG